MEKTRYYAIKGPDGELQDGSLCANTGERSAWELLHQVYGTYTPLDVWRTDMRLHGYYCVEVVEVAEVKEVAEDYADYHVCQGVPAIRHHCQNLVRLVRNSFIDGHKFAQPRWISVSEALPEHGNVVMVIFGRNDTRSIGEYSTKIRSWTVVDPYCLGCIDSMMYGVSVKAWQELPAPPAEGEK